VRPVWLRVLGDMRARLGSFVALALLVAVGGGFVLTAASGARRTGSAFDRFLAASKEEDVDGFVGAPGQLGNPPVSYDVVSHLPMVESAARLTYWFMAFPRYQHKVGTTLQGGQITPFAFADDTAFRTIDRGVLVAGHYPDPSNASEVVISPGMAARRHLKPGDHFVGQNMTSHEIITAMQDGPIGVSGPTVDLVVAGVVREPLDLVQSPEEAKQDVTYLGGSDAVYLTPAFYRRYITNVFGGGYGFGARLKHGARDVPAFIAAVRARVKDPSAFQVQPAAGQFTPARHALHLQAIALWGFAGLASLALFLIVGQALSRQLALDSIETPVLRALGMTRAQLLATSAIEAAVVAVAGAAIAVVIAFVASPLMPVGFARAAEPHPGFAFDGTAIGLGVAIMIVALVARAAAPAWRIAGRRWFALGTVEFTGAESPSRVAAALSRMGASVPAVTGSRMALEPGRGRTSVPVRAALVGAILAVAAFAAAYTIGASLGSVPKDPSLYGWNWDVVVGNPNSPDLRADAIPKLLADRNVGAFSTAAVTGVNVEGHDIAAIGFDTTHGDVMPPFAQGRAPATDGEAAISADVLRALHARVGDRVTLTAGPAKTTVRVVGVPIAQVGGGVVPNGFLALMRQDALERLSQAPVNLFFVRFARGVGAAAGFADLHARFGPVVLRPLPSIDVVNIRRVQWMPYALAALLALLGLATLGHALVTSVRRRRRELAVLKSLGMRKAQIGSTIAWQASTTAIAAIVVGLPAGIAAGRWGWRLIAQQVGLLPITVTPALALAVAVLVTIAAANAIAAAPAFYAARIRPALALRSE